MTKDEILRSVGQINDELATDPIVMPSKFWQSHGRQHVRLLLEHGIENFKRTLAHHFGEWQIVKMSDGNMVNLLGWWANHGYMDCLTDTMEPPGNIGMPFNGVANPLADERVRKIYRLAVSLLWDYTRFIDSEGTLDKVQEPLLGNPLKIWRGDTLLSQSVAHSVRERNLIYNYIDGKLVIGELGAGNGRLAHVFAKTTNCRYLIFDIAPALVVSQWYIKNLFPEEKVFEFRPFEKYEDIEDELEDSKFAFFSANQLKYLPDRYFNVFINVCSLMEMKVETIHHFIRHIDRTTDGLFYTKQWHNQNNEYDNIVFKKEDYPTYEHWDKLSDRTDPINSRLFEQLWHIEHA